MKQASKVTDYRLGCEAIVHLHQVLDELGEKTPPGLPGLAGELFVKAKLSKLGIPFQTKGGHAGFDILLTNREQRNRVEVRTSRPKVVKEKAKGHSWKVQTWKQKEVGFDFLVCVALDQKLSNPRFYIFTRDEALNAQDTRDGRFSSVRKRIRMYASKDELGKAIAGDPKAVAAWEQEVNLNKGQYRNRWQILAT